MVLSGKVDSEYLSDSLVYKFARVHWLLKCFDEQFPVHSIQWNWCMYGSIPRVTYHHHSVQMMGERLRADTYILISLRIFSEEITSVM